MSHQFTVVGLSMSTCTRRVLTALEEKGATYQLQPVNFGQGEHKSAQYLEKHQPFGQIPVFYDGDFKVFESRAIVRYIDDILPGYQLVPKDPRQRALVEQWVSVEMSHYKPAEALVSELIFKKMFGGVTDAAVVDENTKKLHAFFKILNHQLEGKNYLVGNDFTLADLVFMPYTQYLLGAEGFADVLSGYPNIANWWGKISSRPSWQKVIAMK